MAFTWTPVSAGTLAKASHMNEVKTNTDALTTKIGIAPYAWSEMPVSIGDKQEASQITELQNALDYVDTNNVCSAENVTFDSGADSGNDSSVDSGRNVTYNSNVETGYLNDHHDTDNGTNRITYYNNVDTSDYSPYYSGRLSGNDVTDHSGKSLP